MTLDLPALESRLWEAACIMVEVRENQHTGWVPLCAQEVTPKTDPKCWPVREYVVRFANRC